MSDLTPAEELRQAAAHIREVAGKATSEAALARVKGWRASGTR